MLSFRSAYLQCHSSLHDVAGGGTCNIIGSYHLLPEDIIFSTNQIPLWSLTRPHRHLPIKAFEGGAALLSLTLSYSSLPPIKSLCGVWPAPIDTFQAPIKAFAGGGALLSLTLSYSSNQIPLWSLTRPHIHLPIKAFAGGGALLSLTLSYSSLPPIKSLCGVWPAPYTPSNQSLCRGWSTPTLPYPSSNQILLWSWILSHVVPIKTIRDDVLWTLTFHSPSPGVITVDTQLYEEEKNGNPCGNHRNFYVKK